MKAVVMREYGGPEVLKFGNYPDPTPRQAEVLIKVAAASINPIDLLQRSGATKDVFPVQFPGIIGWDVSGSVLKLGPEVDQFSIGDRVFAWAFHTYAELCVVAANLLAKVPDGLDLIEAAALPLVTLTRSQLISIASGIQSGQTILVSGAVGSVGCAAVYTAKEKGARVIAGVRKTQLSEAKGLNVDQVLALDDDAAFGALAPVDVVANTVRGTTTDLLFNKVKDGGTYVSVTGVPDSAKFRPSVHAVAFVSKQDPKTLVHIAEAVRDGKWQIPISLKLPLKDTEQGHIAMEKGGAGKILLLA
jgi:NADPH:quinone reductase-like Zn-dependent oxidoreductase